jgi:hypothetical protein
LVSTTKPLAGHITIVAPNKRSTAIAASAKGKRESRSKPNIELDFTGVLPHTAPTPPFYLADTPQ